MAGSLVRVLVVLAVSALTLTAVPAAPERAQAPPGVVLTAQAQSVRADRLLGRQVGFHVDLAVDFIVTGAELTGRIVAVPQALATDIRGGTPAPVAIRRAVLTLADVEFDAGRELVGYARDYADFQIQFVTGLLPAPLRELIAAGSALATQLVHRLADFAITVVDRAQSTLHRAPSGADAAPADVPKAPEEPAAVAVIAPSPPAQTSVRSHRTVAAPADDDDRKDPAPVSHTDDAEHDSVATTVRPRGGLRSSSATTTPTATSPEAEPTTTDDESAPAAGTAPSAADTDTDTDTDTDASTDTPGATP